ncbi:MAG TPA: right-handed parallel beta-helix repeat-containing protein [Puia sp.]|nr:right-handed parallel beta-helix repeat-containing protein [Puia sp.]
MKKSIFLFLLIIAFYPFNQLTAANYYFSASSGDDSRSTTEAQHLSTPWKTLEKLNSISSILKPGDTIFLKSGEIFYGSINIKSSGTLSSPIIFTDYGSGNKPVISGLEKISKWTSLNNGIYQNVCPACVAENKILIINRIPYALGRYPNSGYLTYQSHKESSAISSNELSGQHNWSGADVVIKKKHWIIDRSNIVSQDGNTLNYAKVSSSSPTDGYGYFIENDPTTLDQFGEWYFDSVRKKMQVFFGDKNPDSYSVSASSKNILVSINGQSFITFDNISFEGANISTFWIRNSKNITIRNCDVDFSGTDAINASGSPYLEISNSFFNHSQNDAITLDSSCRSALIKNNIIKNTGLMPGMGKNGTGTYQAISAFGANTSIEFNEIDSTGYNGIYFGGNSSIAKNNLIKDFCIVKDDGAGIYISDWFPSSDKKIIGNIILNGFGNNEGTTTKSVLQAEGVYIDDKTADILIQSNSIANCAHAGIMIHNAHDIKIEGNTVFNNNIQLLLQHDNLWPNNPIKNLTASKNFFICKTADQVCVNISWRNDDMWSFGILDSNYYYRPANDNNVIQAVSNIWTSKSTTKNFSLQDWQSSYKMDMSSKKILLNTPGNNDMSVEYNFSGTAKKITSKSYYLNADGTLKRMDEFVLQPYQSVIVMKQ